MWARILSRDICSVTRCAPSRADCAPRASPLKSSSASGLAAYVVYRIWIYRKYRLLDSIPRVQVEELARRVASDAAERLLIADVRSHGYYDADSERIAGSIRIEPNNLVEEVKNLPKDREIYLYCT